MIWLFFFKQKTAYDMRISDWSSDVCSSDLRERPAAQDRFEKPVERRRSRVDHRQRKDAGGEAGAGSRQGDAVGDVARKRPRGGRGRRRLCVRAVRDRLQRPRSEEHTSELQSLMRNSYAVFCLKKKTK